MLIAAVANSKLQVHWCYQVGLSISCCLALLYSW